MNFREITMELGLARQPGLNSIININTVYRIFSIININTIYRILVLLILILLQDGVLISASM